MRTRWLHMLALTAALAACGGGEDAPEAKRTGAAAPAAPGGATVQPVAARAPGVQYIAESQADALAAFGGVLELLVEGSHASAAGLAMADAQRLRATRGLPLDTPVLVRGADLALAAVVADRLVASGHKAVWLVTP